MKKVVMLFAPKRYPHESAGIRADPWPPQCDNPWEYHTSSIYHEYSPFLDIDYDHYSDDDLDGDDPR